MAPRTGRSAGDPRMSPSPRSGTLFVVATPIGNLEDLTARAVRVLQEADAICCEDTRHTGNLLQQKKIVAKRLISLHEHNEASRIDLVLGLLFAGSSVAVVSDAGTPLVSDPGGRLVSACARAGVDVVAIPGASAVLAALVVSGFSVDRFSFEGFLPRKGGERVERLATNAKAPVPAVINESPMRIAALIVDLVAVCGGDRQVCVARELTKLHEEVYRGVLAQAGESPVVTIARGEYVVVLDGLAPASAPTALNLVPIFEGLAERGLARRDAIAAVEFLLDVAHRAAYRAALEVPFNKSDAAPPLV